MLPIAETPSQDDLNNTEDHEGEESDEYDIEDDEEYDEEYDEDGDEDVDDEGGESGQNGQRHSNLTALLLSGGEEGEDEEYGEAEVGAGSSAQTGSVKRTRDDDDEDGNKDGDDEQDPKKLKV